MPKKMTFATKGKLAVVDSEIGKRRLTITIDEIEMEAGTHRGLHQAAGRHSPAHLRVIWEEEETVRERLADAVHKFWSDHGLNPTHAWLGPEQYHQLCMREDQLCMREDLVKKEPGHPPRFLDLELRCTSCNGDCFVGVMVSG